MPPAEAIPRDLADALAIDLLAPQQLLDAIIAALRGASAVQIVGHVRPDGDCIGSMLCLAEMLGQWGTPTAMAAEAKGTSGYDSMPGYGEIAERPDPAFPADLTVYVDCASLERGPEDWRPATRTVNIDHHGSNTRFGELQWIEPQCSSVGEMMYLLCLRSGARITPAMAEAMFGAVMTDTGSFRFANAGARQHMIAAKLIEAGARPDEVARRAYSSLSISAVHLTGYVMQHIVLEEGGEVAWSEVRREVYESCGGDSAAPENLSDGLRQVRGVKLAILFHEPAEGGIRVNFRSTGKTNVAQLAATWGGGGHPAAAGLTVKEGDYAALRDAILQRSIETFRASGDAGSNISPRGKSASHTK